MCDVVDNLFISFYLRDVFLGNALVESGLMMGNISYCTEYDLDIYLRGKKGEKVEEIAKKTVPLPKQQPNQYVTPTVVVNAGYTDMTCSAR